VELCASLAEGGITPSVGMLKVIKARISIPVTVMIRPRAGDFLFSDEGKYRGISKGFVRPTHTEFAVMCEDVARLHECGADGFALGILKQDGAVDAPRLRHLQSLAPGRQFTFHRGALWWIAVVD
jgi:copper homeostasis protein